MTRQCVDVSTWSELWPGRYTYCTNYRTAHCSGLFHVHLLTWLKALLHFRETQAAAPISAALTKCSATRCIALENSAGAQTQIEHTTSSKARGIGGMYQYIVHAYLLLGMRHHCASLGAQFSEKKTHSTIREKKSK